MGRKFWCASCAANARHKNQFEKRPLNFFWRTNDRPRYLPFLCFYTLELCCDCKFLIAIAGGWLNTSYFFCYHAIFDKLHFSRNWLNFRSNCPLLRIDNKRKLLGLNVVHSGLFCTDLAHFQAFFACSLDKFWTDFNSFVILLYFSETFITFFKAILALLEPFLDLLKLLKNCPKNEPNFCKMTHCVVVTK